jgi:predicted Rossmann-fold nucleotide-binding protein
LNKLLTFDYSYVGKTMFMRYSMGFVAMLGGLGTMDENHSAKKKN